MSDYTAPKFCAACLEPESMCCCRLSPDTNLALTLLQDAASSEAEKVTINRTDFLTLCQRAYRWGQHESKSALAEVKSPSRRIVCAAIRQTNGFVICGARHFDTIMREQIERSTLDWSRAEQGFIDQRGMFLNRKQALGVADEAGQIIRRCGGDDEELFSENLY